MADCHYFQIIIIGNNKHTKLCYKSGYINLSILVFSGRNNHTGKCKRRFGGIYAYCRYFIDRKW